MRVELFSRKQLLDGYVDTNFASEDLINNWFASVYYHGMDTLHEDLLCDYRYLYFNSSETMEGKSGFFKTSKKELSLWDIVE